MRNGVTEELRAALAVLTQPAAAGGGTGAALDRVEALARELGPDAPAELRHFLERRSYVKALRWLEANASH